MSDWKQKKEAGLSDYVFGKVQPQSVDLEAAVLGALMLDKAAFPVVSQILKPEMFYTDAHQEIYRTMVNLTMKSAPIDLLTVAESLMAEKNIEQVGGAAYLSELTDRVGSSANIEYHAKVVMQKWMQRKSIECASGLIKSCYEDGDVFISIEDFEKEFLKVTNFAFSGSTLIGDVIPKLLERARDVHDRGDELLGLNLSGISSFEELHAGGLPGDLITISGDTGSGKSSFFNNIMCSAVLRGFPVYSWSNELTKEQQASRVIASFSGVNALRIAAGRYLNDESDKKNVDYSVEKIIDKSISLDFGDMGLQKLSSTIINLHKTRGIKVFLFDRLELFDLTIAGRNQEDTAKGMYTTKLRKLANEFGLTIVLAAQLRKSFESRPGKVPTKIDIKGSGAIMQDSTKIFIFYRPERYNYDTFQDGTPAADMGEIIIEKNSHGDEGGRVKVKFYKKRTVWGVDFMAESGLETDQFDPNFKPTQFPVPENMQVKPDKSNDGEKIPF